MARVGHVRVDSTVGSVGSSSLFGGLVDLNVLDDEFFGVETLGVGVGFGVLEEAEEKFGGFDGVAGFGDAKVLACVRRERLAGVFFLNGIMWFSGLESGLSHNSRRLLFEFVNELPQMTCVRFAS